MKAITLEQLDDIFLEMRNDKNALTNALAALKPYFITDALYAFCQKVATMPFFIEGKNPYHNALHTARVLKSLEVLIPREDALKNSSLTELLITAALCHDLGHLGRVNTHLGEQEALAVEIMLEEKTKAHVPGMTQADWDVVASIIMATEVQTNAKAALGAYRGGRSLSGTVSALLACRALMVEADVLSSLTRKCGEENGKLLAKELSLPVIDTVQGRLFFLSEIDFVSQASTSLGTKSYSYAEVSRCAALSVKETNASVT